jgi:hypothetical protein
MLLFRGRPTPCGVGCILCAASRLDNSGRSGFAFARQERRAALDGMRSTGSTDSLDGFALVGLPGILIVFGGPRADANLGQSWAAVPGLHRWLLILRRGLRIGGRSAQAVRIEDEGLHFGFGALSGDFFSVEEKIYTGGVAGFHHDFARGAN